MSVKTCTRCGFAKALDQFPPRRRGKPRLQTWCRACFATNNARYYREHLVAQKTRLLRNTSTRRRENQQNLVAYLQDHPCVDCGEGDVVVLEFDHIGPKFANVSAMMSGSRSWQAIKREVDQCEVRCANCHRVKTARDWPPFNDIAATRAESRRPVQLHIASALGVRECRVCHELKSLIEFPFRYVEPDRQTRQWICLVCQRVYAKGWYGRNRELQVSKAAANKKRRRMERRAQVFDFRSDSACVDCGEANPLLLDFDHVRDKKADVSSLVRAGQSSEVIAAEIAKCAVRCVNCHRRKTARERGWYRARLG